MVNYLSSDSKWKAYQFLDPFARGKFFVCNKSTRVFCTPDCDSRYVPDSKATVEFVTFADEALRSSYQPCEFCEPTSATLIDSQHLIECVSHVNHGINFISPLIEHDDAATQEIIKKDLIKKETGSDYKEELVSYKFSEPAMDVLKNDAEHYKLVDLACRHLAMAAATNVLKPVVATPTLPRDESSKADKKRKRRGGVLGFKELAAKLKLSAWHFHRVFKSVTGVTPKNYGDKCTEFFKKLESKNELATPMTTIPSHPSSELSYSRRGSVEHISPYETPVSLVDDFDVTPKKVHVESILPELDEIPLPSLNNFAFNEQVSTFPEFDFQLDSTDYLDLNALDFENPLMVPEAQSYQFTDFFQIPPYNQPYNFETQKIADQQLAIQPEYLLS